MKFLALILFLLFIPLNIMAEDIILPDVDKDGKVGLGEAIYILQILSGARTYDWLNATNHSVETSCAEDDNINIPITGSRGPFLIKATHPSYTFSEDNCAPDFTNCPPSSGTDYTFTPNVHALFDDGNTVIQAVTEASWWRPAGMQASVNNYTPVSDIHYIRIYKKISGASEWPQILVLYQDGNLRLIPQPPIGMTSVCFGSSVIVGPADVSSRPIAEIEAVKYDSTLDRIEINYASGDTAVIQIIEFGRSITLVRATVASTGDSSAVPFITFRSMFVSEGNNDVDTVYWQDSADNIHSKSIMIFDKGISTDWLFKRSSISVHNTSAPDIGISLESK